MFQAFFTGLSGLFSFSKTLDTVSNNIANMNTPGFRGQDTFYRSLSGNEGTGVGTQVSGLGYRFATGDQTQTGNATDFAINGNGFFVLLDGDKEYYTRAGRFEFKDNILVDSATGYQVAQYTDTGELTKLDISNFQNNAFEKTSKISVSGYLSKDDADGKHVKNDIVVYNQIGEAVTISLTFTRDATDASKWTVSGTDADNNALTFSHTDLTFASDGPGIGNESTHFTVLDSEGGLTTIELSFSGTDGNAPLTAQVKGADSELTFSHFDGKAEGVLTSSAFNADGTITFKYDNGAEVTALGLAFANFANDDVLELVEGSIFKSTNNSARELGNPEDGTLGSLATGTLELSNVDLSREFADMIIVQRGYQASSRVLNIANQMLEQLYDSTRGR